MPCPIESLVPSTLLILDRRMDPITPLLSQWTYQAMVHELLGIRANIVDLTNSPVLGEKDFKKFVLSSEEDPFFRESMFLVWTDVTDKLKASAQKHQSKSQLGEHASLEKMKLRMEEHPERMRSSENLKKHDTLLHELLRIQKQGQLVDVSIAEQTLVCSNSYFNDSKVGLISNVSMVFGNDI